MSGIQSLATLSPIKVPNDSSFERLSLEEFLIKNIKTTDNKRFNYKDQIKIM